MRWRHFLFPILVCLLAASYAGALDTSRSGALVAPDLGLACDHSTDGTPILRALLESGGGAAGKTLTIPSGCKILLGTPEAGRAVAEVASSTTIECADQTAGFVLARHSCAGGDTPGGVCDGTGSDCPGGGTCAYDTGSSEFAPSSSSTYTVFGAAAGTSGQALINCGIWTNQRAVNFSVMGGDDAYFGYCDGGALDTASCRSVCSDETKVPGLLCNADADCGGAAGSCTNRDHCATGGGTCRSWNYTQRGGASGPGTINPVDWSGASRFRIENVTVYDLRHSTTVLNLGKNGRVSNVDAASQALTSNVFSALSIFARQSPDIGIWLRDNTVVSASNAVGWTAAYKIQGAGTVTDSVFGQYGDQTEATWPGTVGFLFRGAGGTAKFNKIGPSKIFICGQPEAGGFVNYPFFMGNECDFGTGPLWQVMGSHNNVQFNRKAWGGYGALISFGELRGRCSGGPRSGLLCLQGTGTNATIGCPQSACVAHADFKGEGGGHFQINDNFLNTDQTAIDGYVAISKAKRCATGSTIGVPCSVDADCSGRGTCSTLGFVIGQFNDNELYNVPAGATAFNLDSPALAPVTGLNNVSFVGNTASFAAGATGFKFPSTAEMATALRVEGNLLGGAATAFSQWDPAMGVLVLPGSEDIDAQTDTLTLTTATTEFAVLTLPDYDNTNRKTALSASVQLNASGGARDFTVRMRIEGVTCATMQTSVPAAKSSSVALHCLDTTSAPARTVIVSVEAADGTANTVTSRQLMRVTL